MDALKLLSLPWLACLVYNFALQRVTLFISAYFEVEGREENGFPKDEQHSLQLLNVTKRVSFYSFSYALLHTEFILPKQFIVPSKSGYKVGSREGIFDASITGCLLAIRAT